MNKSLVLAMCDILILSTLNLSMGLRSGAKIHVSDNPPAENSTNVQNPDPDIDNQGEIERLRQRIQTLEIDLSNAVARAEEARDEASRATAELKTAQLDVEEARTLADKAGKAEATAKNEVEKARNALETAQREAKEARRGEVVAKTEAEEARKGQNCANSVAIAIILLALVLQVLFGRRGSSR